MGRFSRGDVLSDLCFQKYTLSGMEGMDFKGARTAKETTAETISRVRARELWLGQGRTGDAVRKHWI